MRDVVRFPLVLGAITLASAAGLAITYSATRDEIRAQQRLAGDRALATVFRMEAFDLENGTAERPWRPTAYPGPSGTLDDGFVVYEAKDPATGATLYASEGRGQGYSSKVRVIAAVDAGIEVGDGEATIRAVEVVSQVETPGLGSHCEDADFQRQFANLPVMKLAIDKTMAGYRDPDAPNAGEQKIAAITGATITTKAVVTAVRQALARIRHHVQNRQQGGT